MTKRFIAVFLIVALLIGIRIPGQQSAHAAAGTTPYFIIPFYDNTYPFSEGIGRVRKEGKISFIDKTGKIIGEPKVKDIGYVGPFNQGVAVGSICGLFGCDIFLMNSKGLRITGSYYQIELFDAPKGLYKAIIGATVLPWDKKTFYDKYTLMDKTGREIKGLEFNDIKLTEKEGVYWIKKITIVGSKVVRTESYINAEGKAVQTPQSIYSTVQEPIEGMSVVSKGGKYGYIDQQGKEMVKPVYDQAFAFKQGLGLVQVGMKGKDPNSGTFGVVDQKGEMVLEPIYRNIRIQDNGLLIVERDNAKGAFVQDADGKVIYENNELGLISDYSDGLAIASFYAGSVYVDDKGQEVLRITTPNPEPFRDGAALVDDGSRFIDKNGREIAELQSLLELLKTRYDTVSNFYSGIAVVSKGDLYGFIDRSGNEIFAPQFTYTQAIDEFQDKGLLNVIDQNNKKLIISRFGKVYEDTAPDMRQEGLMPVKQAGKWGFVDLEGKEIVSPVYDEVKSFVEGIALVKQVGKWGTLNREGRVAAQPLYTKINPYVQELALVERDGQVGFIDRSGAEVIEAQFEAAEDFAEGCANVKKEGRWGYILHPVQTEMKAVDSPVAEWAKADVQKAIDTGLLPLFLQRDYAASLTWEELCALMVRFIEVKADQPVERVLTARKIKFDSQWNTSAISDLPFGSQGLVVRRPVMASVSMGLVGVTNKQTGAIIVDLKGKVSREKAVETLVKLARFMNIPANKAKAAIQKAEGKRSEPYYSRQQAYKTLMELYQAK